MLKLLPNKIQVHHWFLTTSFNPDKIMSAFEILVTARLFYWAATNGNECDARSFSMCASVLKLLIGFIIIIII